MGSTQNQILKDTKRIKTISEEYDLSPNASRLATEDEIYFNWLCADPKCKKESYAEIAKMIAKHGYIEIPASLQIFFNPAPNKDLNKDLQATLKIQHKIIHEIAIRNYLYRRARPTLSLDAMKLNTKDFYNYDFDKGITNIESGFIIAFIKTDDWTIDYLQKGREKTKKFMNEQQNQNNKNTKPLVYAPVSKRVELTYEPKYETRANQILNNAAKLASNAAQVVSDAVNHPDKYTKHYRDEKAKNSQPIGRS